MKCIKVLVKLYIPLCPFCDYNCFIIKQKILISKRKKEEIIKG